MCWVFFCFQPLFPSSIPERFTPCAQAPLPPCLLRLGHPINNFIVLFLSLLPLVPVCDGWLFRLLEAGAPTEVGGVRGRGGLRYTWRVTGLSLSQTSLLLRRHLHLCQSASSLNVAGHCLLQVWSYLWFQEARLAQPVGGILCPLGQCLSLAFGKFWMVLTQD